MMEQKSPNAPHLIAVALRLRPILAEAVFVGGQVTELMITEPAAVRVRPTLDVDLVVEVASRTALRRLERNLVGLGLAQDTREGAPICRWRTPEGFVVDVMPSEVHVLGFSNRWYPLALERSYDYELTADVTIRLPEPPVYLGTKWEAFQGRGGGDLLGSHDLEDIIALVAGRPEIVREVAATQPELRAYLSEACLGFLAQDLAEYAVQGAVPDAGISPMVLEEVLDRFRLIAANLSE